MRTSCFADMLGIVIEALENKIVTKDFKESISLEICSCQWGVKILFLLPFPVLHSLFLSSTYIWYFLTNNWCFGVRSQVVLLSMWDDFIKNEAQQISINMHSYPVIICQSIKVNNYNSNSALPSCYFKLHLHNHLEHWIC